MLDRDFKLSTTEFAYDTPVTRTTNKNLYEIVDGFKTKQDTNLIPITDRYKVSEFASSCASSVASHVYKLHEKISNNVTQNNANYTLRANV